jgi:ribosome-associated heat shock protein Hsp15
MTPIAPAATQRLDRWLWCARFAKSRALAARLCTSERVMLGGAMVQKAHHAVRVGDRLTLRLGRFERRIEVLALAQRRGPASEARTLYAETAPPTPLGEAAEPWTSLFADEDEHAASG